MATLDPDAVPQFAAPFTIGADGLVATVEQNSVDDIAACVYNAIACPQGMKPGDAQFGIPWPLFQTVPLDTKAILAAVQRLEPRADLEITEIAQAFNAAIRDVQVRVGIAGSTP